MRKIEKIKQYTEEELDKMDREATEREEYRVSEHNKGDQEKQESPSQMFKNSMADLHKKLGKK